MAEVEVHLRKRYQCSVCGRSSSSKRVMERHIAEGCIKDADARACPTCVHQHAGEYGGFVCMLGLLDGLEREDGSPANFIKHCSEWSALDD